MFRKTNNYSFAGPGYIKEIEEIQRQTFDRLEDKITVFLLNNLLLDQHQKNEFLINDLIKKLDNPFIESVLIENLIKDLPSHMQRDVLVIFLTNLLNRLSVTQYSFTSLPKQNVEKPKETKSLPSLSQVVAKQLSLPTINCEVDERKTLYHTALTIRDSLIMKGHGRTWSKKFQDNWTGNLREKLQYDIAALSINFFKEQHRINDFCEYILKQILKSVAKDYINFLRMRNSTSGEDQELDQLVQRLLESVEVLKIDEAYIENLVETLKTNSVIGIREYTRKYVKDHVDQIKKLLLDIVQQIELEEDIISTKFDIKLLKEEYSNELLLRIGGSYIGSFDGTEEKEKAFYELIAESLLKKTEVWLNYWNSLSLTTDWFVALSLKKVNINSTFTIDNCIFMPTETAREYIKDKFHINNMTSMVLPNPERDSSWAVIEKIEAHKDDSEQVISIARRKVKKLLSALTFIVGKKDNYGFILGEFTLSSRKLNNGHYSNLSGSFEGKANEMGLMPLDFIEELNPNDKPWGEYLNIIYSIDSPLANRVKLSLEKFYELQRVNVLEKKYVQILDCFQTLASKPDEPSSKWIDRVVFILAGPNIPEQGYTYGEARSWLKSDFINYLFIKEQIIKNNKDFALDLLIPRLESMLTDCLLSIYSTLSDPALTDINDLILWYAEVRPDKEKIGGAQ